MGKPIYKHKMPNIICITKIVSLHYFEFGKNYKFYGEAHDFWEMVYADKGEIIVTSNKNEHILHQGEGIFHKPNEFHKLEANGVVAPNVFVVSFVCNSSAMNFFKNRIIKFSAPLKSIVASIIKEGFQTFELPCFNPNIIEMTLKEKPVLGGRQMIKIYLEQLLIMMMRKEKEVLSSNIIFDTKENVEDHTAAALIEYMEKRIYGKLDITELCEHFSYGKTFISSTFKKATGFSVMEYYNKMKIEEAKKLLREKNYNITQISNLLMYESAQYFARVFKRVTGMTPTEYIQSVKID
ncbi:MAG: AraC family transcriptional regulator [Bacillota bacterium]|nr:AraC family transcriptional regulator [Bacillota bacterium]